jgi:hypothetical protein
MENYQRKNASFLALDISIPSDGPKPTIADRTEFVLEPESDPSLRDPELLGNFRRRLSLPIQLPRR